LQANAQKLKGFGFNFKRAMRPKLAKLIQFLKSRQFPVNEETKLAALGWLQLCDKKHYQAINTELETYQLIRLLKGTGFKETNIALFVSNQMDVAMLKKLFLMNYSIPPAIFGVAERRDRPPMYLTICDKVVNVGQEPYGAANCMTGFRAIMLSLAVMLRMESPDE